MTFDEHIRSIWKKASAKLNKLNRAATFMCPDKRHLIMNIFFSAQFNYYSLIWMFDNRILNQKINRFHERYSVSLRIQSECGKMWTRKNSVFGHISHSVNLFRNSWGKSYTKFAIHFNLLVVILICTKYCEVRQYYEHKTFNLRPVATGLFVLAIPNKILWMKYSNPVKLDKTTKLW